MLCGLNLYLQDLIVNQNHRREGVGSLLFNHDYYVIELVQPSNTDKFHEQRAKFSTQLGFDLRGRHNTDERYHQSCWLIAVVIYINERKIFVRYYAFLFFDS